MKNLLLAFGAVLLFACHTPNGPAAPADAVVTDLTNYQTFDVPGSYYRIAELRDADNHLVESGMVDGNSVKNGSWVVYHPGNDIPKTVATMVNGVYAGPYNEFSNRGQLEASYTYINNELHGKFAKFKFGRKTEEGEYNFGQPNGVWITYYNNKETPQKLTTYKDGQMDGILQFFDEEGNVTVEYEYKNGEKVSGGIVE